LAGGTHQPVTIVFSAGQKVSGGVRLVPPGLASDLHFYPASMVLEAADKISERRKQQSN